MKIKATLVKKRYETVISIFNTINVKKTKIMDNERGKTEKKSLPKEAL